MTKTPRFRSARLLSLKREGVGRATCQHLATPGAKQVQACPGLPRSAPLSAVPSSPQNSRRCVQCTEPAVQQGLLRAGEERPGAASWDPFQSLSPAAVNSNSTTAQVSHPRPRRSGWHRQQRRPLQVLHKPGACTVVLRGRGQDSESGTRALAAQPRGGEWLIG